MDILGVVIVVWVLLAAAATRFFWARLPGDPRNEPVLRAIEASFLGLAFTALATVVTLIVVAAFGIHPE